MSSSLWEIDNPPTELTSKILALNKRDTTRIIIVGHGSWLGGTVAKRKPDEVAQLLANSGLVRVSKISLLACYAGGNVEGEYFGGIKELASVESFGAALHRILGKEHDIYTELSASTRSTQIVRFYHQGDKKWTAQKQVWVPNKNNREEACFGLELSDDQGAARVGAMKLLSPEDEWRRQKKKGFPLAEIGSINTQAPRRSGPGTTPRVPWSNGGATRTRRG